MAEERKSELVTWLEGLPKWHRDLDVAPMKNHDGTAVRKIRFVVNSKAQEDQAIINAYAELDEAAKKAGGAAEVLRFDPEFLTDFKTVQALHAACKDPNDPEYPIFPTPTWLKENLTSQELSYLLNLYNACKLEAAGIPQELDRERVDAYRDAMVAAFDSDVPERTLAMLPREQLTTLAVMMAKHWHDEREGFIARVADLEAKADDLLAAAGKLDATAQEMLAAAGAKEGQPA